MGHPDYPYYRSTARRKCLSCPLDVGRNANDPLPLFPASRPGLPPGIPGVMIVSVMRRVKGWWTKVQSRGSWGNWSRGNHQRLKRTATNFEAVGVSIQGQ